MCRLAAVVLAQRFANERGRFLVAPAVRTESRDAIRAAAVPLWFTQQLLVDKFSLQVAERME